MDCYKVDNDELTVELDQEHIRFPVSILRLLSIPKSTIPGSRVSPGIKM